MTHKPALVAIIDDEDCVRKALGRLLRSAGLGVAYFRSGLDFVHDFDLLRPDCVILDLHMPGMDGFEVLSWLAHRAAGIPVIVITGHDSPETRQRALAGGPMAYLLKPVDGRALLDTLQRCAAAPVPALAAAETPVA
jgi:FixJ family two-component response regulator